MLNRVCCLRLKTAGYVFGGIDVFLSTICFGLLIFIFLDSDNDLSNDVGWSLMVFVCLLKFVFSVILVIGIKKQRHQLLVPWLTFSALQLIALIFVSSVAIGFSFIFNYKQSILFQFLCFLLIVLPSWVLSLYIYVGIYSLYKEIQVYRNQQDNQFAYVQCTLPKKPEEICNT